MNARNFIIRLSIKSLLLALIALYSAFAGAAVPIVVDTFALPAAPTSKVAYGTLLSSTHQVAFNNLASSILGGIRGTTFNVYSDPLKSISAVSVGRGTLSVAQGTGAMAETLIAYGAFTRPQPNVGGPLLNLDLSTYDGLQLDFSGAEDGMNINVVYYTSSPLNQDSPLYYATNGVNIAPPTAGGPLSFVLGFDKVAHADFNWSHVDGIIVVINRSGPIPHTSYTLDKLTLVSK
ncbi:MAG: hypothetical protein IPN42_01115 [Methylococcaceae bacterium]|nr:hypothetical protein [Methylococcaceae bacterium]